MKRHCLIFFLILILALCFTGLAAAEVTAGGSAGQLTWSLSSDGVLTISGTGRITNSPWRDYCDDIKSVVVTDGVTDIGDWAFAYCENLETVSFPDSLMSIGAYAFFSCDHIDSITIPSNTTEIGIDAFHYCHALSDISFDSQTEYADYYYYNTYYHTLYVLPVPESVHIANGIVFGGTRVGRAILPDFNIPEDYSHWGEITFLIEEEAFSGIAATYVVVPNSVKEITSRTFAGCQHLHYVYFANNNCRIADDAFIGCRSDLMIICEDIWNEEGKLILSPVHQFANTQGYTFIRVYPEGDG